MAGNIPFLPEDVLRIVFKNLSLKDLLQCRNVNRFWRMAVDNLLENDVLWYEGCKEFFKETYEQARRHRSPLLTWRDLYQSQGLWSDIKNAEEQVEKYSLITRISQEIVDFQLLTNGFIGIHSRSSITRFNILTKEDGSIINGIYKMYAENNNHIILLSNEEILTIHRKVIYKPTMLIEKTYSIKVKAFLLIDPLVIVLTVNNQIHYIQLKDDLLETQLIVICMDRIICMGAGSDEILYILTSNRKVLRLVSHDHFESAYVITGMDNLLNILLRFNLTDNMNWLVYQQWLHNLRRLQPLTGIIQDITIVKKYGEVVLIGTMWGDLFIYYVPKNGPQVSLYSKIPDKAFYLSNINESLKYIHECPIIKIDVIEGKNKHIVVAATPKQLITVTLQHIVDPEED